VRQLTADDLPAVLDHDRAVFGGDRGPLLTWAHQQAPQYARMLEDAGSGPQYTFGRPGRLFDQIGPVVAVRETGATALLADALAHAQDRAVVVDVFDHSGDLAAWLGACGFAGQRPLFRMRKPAVGAPHHAGLAPSSEFAIAGPDVA
jgi:hypothetical protein